MKFVGLTLNHTMKINTNKYKWEKKILKRLERDIFCIYFSLDIIERGIREGILHGGCLFKNNLEVGGGGRGC